MANFPNEQLTFCGSGSSMLLPLPTNSVGDDYEFDHKSCIDSGVNFEVTYRSFL